MSHVIPEENTERRRRANCRKGRHDFGENQHVGGGIIRRVCDVCGSVTIDLTQGEGLTAPVLASSDSILKLARRR